jgi:hypothetical protein
MGGRIAGLTPTQTLPHQGGGKLCSGDANHNAALVIDIHTSNIFLCEIPQVRINQTFAEMLVPLARRMNVDLIWLHGAVTVLEATIAHSRPCLESPWRREFRPPRRICWQPATTPL